jgi:hypothetical protein
MVRNTQVKGGTVGDTQAPTRSPISGTQSGLHKLGKACFVAKWSDKIFGERMKCFKADSDSTINVASKNPLLPFHLPHTLIA